MLSPVGTAEILGHPYGTQIFLALLPSTEVLGYCQSSPAGTYSSLVTRHCFMRGVGYRLGDLVEVEGLADDAVDEVFVAGGDGGGRAVAGDEDDGRVTPAAANLARSLPAVHLRHREVREDQIEAPRLHRPQALAPASGRVDAVAQHR